MPEYTLAEIARKIGGEVHGDANIRIHGIAEIANAKGGELTFLANPKYRILLEKTRASAVIINAQTTAPPSLPHIRMPNAYFGFLQAFLLFNKPKQMLPAGIHPTAVIHETAKIGKDVKIGAHVYLGSGVTIGDRSEIFPNCVILDDSTIGDDCRLYPLVSVREDCRIGNRVIIHNGAVIGCDGFGFALYQGKFHKIPQAGKVVIEDDVELGANVTIDRGTLGETRICQGVKLDNLVHIAHNVVIGKHTAMAAQTGISGSTTIGENVMMGGQVGVVGHITIGDGARVSAQAGVTKSIAPGKTVFGSPARPIFKARRIEATLNELPKMRKRLAILEKKLAKLEKENNQLL